MRSKGAPFFGSPSIMEEGTLSLSLFTFARSKPISSNTPNGGKAGALEATRTTLFLSPPLGPF